MPVSHMRTQSTRFQLAFAALLTIHAIISIIYSFSTPLWESYDETGHYAYARYIAIHHALPPANATLAQYNESHQPPLYYALVALPISLIDTSDDAQPRFAIGGGVYVVPDAQIDAFPYRGTALALRLGRMVSVILSTLTVAIVCFTVRTALPQRADIALLAMAISALWPLTLFLGGTITNDIGMTFFGALTLWTIVRLWAKPPQQSRRRVYFALALCLAGAVLVKDNAISLLLFAVVAVGLLIARDVIAKRSARLRDLLLPFIVLAALVIAGGVVSEGRSLRQFSSTIGYAAFVATPDMAQIAAPNPVVSTSILDRTVFLVTNFANYLWRLVFETMFGTFGWGLVRMPAAWYDMAIAGALIAAGGLVLALVKHKDRWFPLLMVLMLSTVALAPTIRTLASANLSLVNGRFLLPGLGALTILLAFGLAHLPRLIARVSAAYVLAGIALVAVMSPALVIQPFYQKPKMLDPVTIPDGIQFPLDMTYGGAIRLLGYSLPVRKTYLGDIATIRLYWRALQPMSKDFGLRVENFTANGVSLQNGLDFTPGRSVYPTSFWKVGDTFSEDYYLPLRSTALAPTTLVFKVTWFDPAGGNVLASDLAPTCQNGQTCEPKFGQLPVGLDSSAAKPWANLPALFRLGAAIDLVQVAIPASVQAGQTMTVSLVWRAGADGLPALTTFVHLLAADGAPKAQTDSPPRNNTYPVNLWSKGEIIPDAYVIQLNPGLPAGRYHLAAGMYDPKTVERIPAFDASGAALPDYAIPLGVIDVK